MQPLVSIILPVRNEEKYISRCLQSIANQDHPQDRYEIIIIDGCSTDATLDKIAEFRINNADSSACQAGGQPFDTAQGKSQNDMVGSLADSSACQASGRPFDTAQGKSQNDLIKVLSNPKRTVSAGLNIGFKNAKGDVLIRMDAHALYAPDYISSCLKVMEETGAANVGGPALALPGGNTPMAQAIALAHLSPFGLGGGAFRNPNAEGWVETVWPGCFRREVFDKVGYIDERRTRTEDIEFNSRLRAAGYKIYLSPMIKAYYYCRTTLRETWRQRWADGCEITRFLPDNPKAPRLRHFIPLIFVATLILLFMLALITTPTPPCHFRLRTGCVFLSAGSPRCGEGLLECWKGLNLFNLFNRSGSFNRLVFRLLLLELGAYFAAMLLAVIQAGKTQFKKACPEGGWRALLRNGFEAVGGPGAEEASGFPIKPGMTRRNGPDNSIFNIQNSKFSPGILALLPVVFLTLHFSYGLGSLWGLVTLAGWAGKRRNV